MEPSRKLVAMFEISDNANEDRWADAMWRAEDAAKEAAIESGSKVEDLKISRHHQGYVIVTGLNGQEFEARVVTDRKIPGYAFPKRREPPPN